MLACPSPAIQYAVRMSHFQYISLRPAIFRYFLSLSLNLAFNFPKNPLARFDFLSVDADAVLVDVGLGLTAAGALSGVCGVGLEVVGAELAPTPVVTLGWFCAWVCADLTGLDIGEMSRESGWFCTAYFIALPVAGV